MANTQTKGKRSGGSKKAAPSVNDFLTANAGTTPKKGKRDIPVLNASTLADDTANAYREMKDAEAEYRALEAKVIELTGPEYERRAKANEFTKSFDLPGATTEGVQVSYSDKFSDLPAEAEEGLREQLGDEAFDANFESKRVLTLSKTDDATIALLRKKLGDDTFRDIFDIKLSLAVKPDMDRRQFDLDEGVRTLSGLKQAKPSVKLIKSSKGKK